MRENRLRIGMEVVQKTSGKKFRVTNVETAEDGKVAEAVEIMPLINLPVTEKPEKVTISKANDICFRITFDPGPTDPVEGYKLEDGIIFINENPVEQGEIVVDEILAALPGGLVVTVKTDFNDSLVHLYFYDVERDVFEMRHAGIPKDEITVIKSVGTEVYLGYNSIISKKEKQEDGTEKIIREFDHGTFFKISYGKLCYVTFNENPLLFDKAEFDGRFIYIPYEESCTEDNILKPCDRGYDIFDVKGAFYRLSKVTCDAVPACNYVPYSGNMLVRTDNKLYVNGREELRTDMVSILADYPLLVDVTAKSKYEIDYTFADKECTKVVTITKTSTKDRGDIYKSSLE